MKKTRKFSSLELMGLVKKGPMFSDVFDKPYSPEKASAQYRIWAASWVVPLLEQLVPELKPAPRQPEGERIQRTIDDRRTALQRDVAAWALRNEREAR